MKITEAKPLHGFRLLLRFDNGETGEVDLSDFSGRGVFAAWLLPGFFQQVAVGKYGDVSWPGEIDLCPDALYLKMSGKSPEDIFPALQSHAGHAWSSAASTAS